MFLKDKMKNIARTYTTAKQMLQTVWAVDCGKKYIFAKLFLSIVHSITPLIYIILPGLIINDLSESYISAHLVIHVAILVIAPFINTLINSFIGQVSFRYYQNINLQFTREFEYHIAHMDYEILEDPETQDFKDRAENVLQNLTQIVDQLFGLLESFIQLISIISLISLLHPLITCMNIVIVLINAVLTQRHDKKEYERTKNIQSKVRKQYGISFNLRSMDYAKDIRLFDIASFLLDKVIAYQVDVNNDVRKSNAERNKINILQSFINVINEIILYVYIVFRVLYHNLKIGDMTIFLTSARQFTSSLSGFTKIYVALSNNTYKYEEYKNFMSIPLRQYESGKKHPYVDKDSVFEFKNVGFKYPGTDRYILKNFNLKMNLNEKLCIVGKNGVGKTTFVKLLTRLYLPTEGEILLNGININDYDYNEYLSAFTAVFQDSKDFNLSLAENIAFSSEYDIERLDDVCKSSGIHSLIQKLSKKYDTLVGKWMDPEGINLSGGELQRMTISRAAYRGGLIYILDEPTAALDPMAEYDIYSTFNEMISDKCAIFITHRLSAVQLADNVAVFDDGHVAEYGTHSELYAKGGIYTEMFDKQAKFYRDEPCVNAEGV